MLLAPPTYAKARPLGPEKKPVYNSPDCANNIPPQQFCKLVILISTYNASINENTIIFPEKILFDN